MRLLQSRALILCAVACASTTFASPSYARNPPHVPGPSLPNHRLTPGAHFHGVGRAKICRTGYSARVRDVPPREADAAYARYRIKRVAYAYEVDHLISLELGGSNALTNLWPEHYYNRGARAPRYRLENRLHALVCDGRLSLVVAQRQEAANWIKAYKRYVLPKH